jgi:hypothetical protein
MSWSAAAAILAEERRVLVILNARRDALELLDALEHLVHLG